MGRGKSRARRPVRSRIAIGALAAVVLAFPGARADGQAPPGVEPPTIEKVIVEQNASLQIAGEGRPGNVVDVVSDDGALGEAIVSANGQWRLDLRSGLKPGTHQIRVSARAGATGPQSAGDEIRLAIPSELGARAVDQYDGTTGDAERLTRQRAEALAQDAGQAFDEITQRPPQPAPAAPAAKEQTSPPPTAAPSESALTVVIEWLKRSARTYREDVVQKLGVAKPSSEATEVRTPTDRAVSGDAREAAATIAKGRAEAEARRVDIAEADAARKATEGEKSAANLARKEALKRAQADELARKKAEADKRIADELERLKKAKEEADRVKVMKDSPRPRTAITLERFYLPGEKQPKSVSPAADAGGVETASRTAYDGPCGEGRVVHKKGRRWYVTGADDTLWDIAERFYGSGLAYSRIYRANRKRLANPHVVRPCLALRLPGRA